MQDTIAIEDLKVGMFIHLEGGWMSHPFPLSSFRIGSADEIARIRGLGVRSLRWSREKSLLDDGAPVPVNAPGHEAAAAVATAPSPEAQRRALLDAQRASARRCEAQYSEAAAALKQAVADVRSKPDAAREASTALALGLHQKMLGDEQMCIRVLSAGAGEKPMAHALNVTVISMLMGRLIKLGEAEMIELGVGALLHDIGKLELPHRVHHHDERLTPAEANAYRDHVRLGVQLAKRMKLSDAAVEIIQQHHEHADGSGFPQRLIMDRMSDAARVVSLVNRYDSLCNNRVPGRQVTPHEALSRLFAQGKGKFDATMLNAFIRMMGVYPAGSIVQLTDDRFAVVTHVNASRPLKPQVLVFDAKVPRDDALTLNLLHEPDLGIRRSLPAAQLPEAAREYLQPAPKLAYFFEPVAAPGELEPSWL
jgi:putative nucleotidyltransferase with HDIG domain